MSASLAAYVQVSCFLTHYVVCQYPTMYGFSGMPQMIPYETPFQQTHYYDNTFQSQHRHKHKSKNKNKKGHRRHTHAFRRAQSSESSSRSTESENDSSEECTCDFTCGQCSVDNNPKCCNAFCSTCIESQNMNQGVLFVPYPYPIVVTNGQQYEPQPGTTKNETSNKENNPPNTENSDKTTDKPKNDQTQDETQDKTQDETQDGNQDRPQDKTQDRPQDETQDGTQDGNQERPRDKTQDRPQDETQDGNQDRPRDETQNGTQDGTKDNTQDGNQRETKDEPETGGRRKFYNNSLRSLNKKVISNTETKKTTQIRRKLKNTTNSEDSGKKTIKQFVDSQNIASLSGDIFNDIIFKVPNTNNTKYVLTSIKRINENWLPKYGIVPIPEKVASDLMAKLKSMKTIQQFRETRTMYDLEAPKNSIYSSENFQSTKTVIPTQDNSSSPNKIETILVRDSGSGLTFEGPKSAIQKFNRRLLESMQIKNELQKFTEKGNNPDALPIELVKKIYQY